MKTSQPSVRRHQAANVGVIILIVLSLALCGLVAYQWTRETTFRKGIEQLRQTNAFVLTLQSEAEAKATRYQHELGSIEKLRADLVEEGKTNRAELSRLKIELSKISLGYQNATNALAVYSNAVAQANQSILVQNDSIKKLNEEFKKLAADRNELATKYNALATDYSKSVDEYNKLVKQFEDYQKQVAEAQAQTKK